MKALSEYTTQRRTADFAGFIAYDADGDEVFTFGKYQGLQGHPGDGQRSGYMGWILDADFPLYTKKVITALRLRGKNTKDKL